jgi:lysophospholipase L1-like esterase
MFSKTWPALALALALLTSHAVAQKTQPAPLRIMPIGDSITEGGDGSGGFRRPLFDKLTAVWGMPNFVGSRNMRQSDPADFVDQDEDGYSAYRIEQITTGKGFWDALPIEERLKAWDPAVVTIHAGTNDAQQAYRYAGAIDRLDQLVSRIVAFNPEIHVFLAQIIPANPPASVCEPARIRLGCSVQGVDVTVLKRSTWCRPQKRPGSGLTGLPGSAAIMAWNHTSAITA